jgi:nitroimidazol reductase NimA-like FMN-containing flavoprotein (pyridoxamine 5'-phosphate oxidase superfamily)
MHHELRRKERVLTEPEAMAILERGEYGILSTCDPDGQPYGIPLSYCLENDAIYFHCAVEGHKLNNIAADNRVSFCVVGRTEVLPGQFATKYESVVIFGRATEAFDGLHRGQAGTDQGIQGRHRRYLRQGAKMTALHGMTPFLRLTGILDRG